MDPAEARIFLNWGHVHRQRAIVYNSMGNSSDAEEQLRLAKDMYDPIQNFVRALILTNQVRDCIKSQQHDYRGQDVAC